MLVIADHNNGEQSSSIEVATIVLSEAPLAVVIA
jgi:hypothetical protein